MIATIDFETTGLKAGEDEVLQVSIIDENYNVLLNVYCRPNNKGSWEDAQAVHGITPLMVANELPFNEELDLAVKKGELHRSEDIEKVMTAMLINFKSRLSAIPAEEADKLAAMTDKAKIFLYLNDKIKEALNELSDFEGMFKEEIKDEEGND